MVRLERQLKTEFKKDAEDCIEIYNKLKEMSNGRVWSGAWNPLTDVTPLGLGKGYQYKPSSIGYGFLKGIRK